VGEKPDEKIYQRVSGEKSQHFKLLDIHKEIITHLSLLNLFLRIKIRILFAVKVY